MPEADALHDRVHALLAAVSAISAEIDLPNVLQTIVRSAAELTAARYVALGVLGREGGLVEFVTYGISDEQRAAIPTWPRGRGILGTLVTDPRPLRLRRLGDDPRAYGFPPNHPPMDSFLGVPVRTQAQVYGNLYLTEKQTAEEFSAEDEQLVVALAAAAGVAIDNARLHASTEQRGRWLQASADITQALLSRADRHTAMQLVAQRAREVTGADLAVVVLPAEDTGFVVEAADGLAADELLGQRLPGAGVLTDVLDSGRTLVVDRAQTLGGATSALLNGCGPALFVPLRSSAAGGGVLVVAAEPGNRLGSSGAELELIRSFADQAAVALDRAQAQRDRATLAVLEDRDRIARDLHDMVIQRLFATGLQLQGAVAQAGSTRMSDTLTGAVEELDTTIKEIRTTIFELHRSPVRVELSGELRALVEEYRTILGFRPHLELADGLDAAVPAPLRQHVLAVVREALSNAARHAQATSVAVSVLTTPTDITVSVRDDGVGIPALRRESGLRNVRERAAQRGGNCDIHSEPASGTVLEWRVPRI
jgi:signal transduction histidine kinase